ncbi:hypothetical protein CC85DRAFT_94234 [Cutaneotrichosporon oleaginosum]|uniref:Uncharacterized protein n=1 Tax=Cutaneotrichosporon oleaginosum TaxID=879819 RepID=A0A0J0XM91_9TREE|nr:uncharacterized protein CC85DRAFT_94234 [Cutaneotrichosporon oleaginosum]KLT42241.1 hypothetical protein CC85DRAFT_94234 [Cutaneotrichosporon oleaginosum]TXT11414.1 hypothetical protein COLE_01824 [Cutaneotrichosporon oleaginosum]
MWRTVTLQATTPSFLTFVKTLSSSLFIILSGRLITRSPQPPQSHRPPPRPPPYWCPPKQPNRILSLGEDVSMHVMDALPDDDVFVLEWVGCTLRDMTVSYPVVLEHHFPRVSLKM